MDRALPLFVFHEPATLVPTHAANDVHAYAQLIVLEALGAFIDLNSDCWFSINFVPSQVFTSNMDIGMLVDTHCHPTDSSVVNLSKSTASMYAICAMSTHIEDQIKVEELHGVHPDIVRPYYGV